MAQRTDFPRIEHVVNGINRNTTLIRCCTNDWQETSLIPSLNGFDRHTQYTGCFPSRQKLFLLHALILHYFVHLCPYFSDLPTVPHPAPFPPHSLSPHSPLP